MDHPGEDVFPTTERTRLRRLHERRSHEHAAVYEIVDAAPLCHVGYVIDGVPFVTPTLHWRAANRVYWHGSAASRMLRRSADAPVCLTVSMMDGFVLARSAFNHSANYRSAMLFGIARRVEGAAEKEAALRDLMEQRFPGRWERLRPMTQQELKATDVLWMEIEEASAKVRTGPPRDDEDAAWPVWAGVLPMRTEVGQPEDAPDLPAGVRFGAD